MTTHSTTHKLRGNAWKTVVMAALFVASTTCLSQSAAAPLFTSEPQLEEATYSAGIEQFWKSSGRTGHFDGNGGVRISFAAFVQTDKDKERGAIVIVSGRTESMLKYKELIYDLWRNGYSVYIHDHRGQGLSGREPEVKAAPEKGHVVRFDDYVDDLTQFVTATVLPAGHRQHFLLAHSMGGAITALFLESDNPVVARFQSAVLSSPMLGIQGIGGLSADLLICQVAKVFVTFGRATSYVLGGKGYSPKSTDDNEYTKSPVRYDRLLDQYRIEPSIRLGSPTNGWLANACDAAVRARSNVERIRTPVMVIVAASDPIVDNGRAVEFCKSRTGASSPAGCGGPHGGPVVIPDALHELLIERDAQRDMTLRHVLRFFGFQPL